MVTADFFAVLGIAPALGRHFIRSDYETGSPEAAILSNGVWRRAFGGDSSVIDREVLLDGLPHRIVGVMPAAFAFPYDADLWMPLFPELGPDDEGARRYHRYRVAGLLATGATRTTAQAQVSTIASRLEAEHPETNRDNGFSVVSLLDVVVGEAEPALRALLGAVALLLLIACANIAGLFLVRGATRDNELAIRRTLGASRANVIAQLLSEGLLLAMVGGAVGLVVATWLVEGFKQLVGPALPRSEAVALDGSTIAVGIILSIAIGLVSGAAPVLRALRRGSAIVQSGRRTSSSRDVVRFRRMLVVAQLALASVLVVGSVLLARSFAHLSAVETGVEVDGLLALPVSLPEGRYQDAVSRHAFFRAALEQIEQRPEVTGAAAGLVAPLSGFGWGNGLRVEGQAVPENQVPTVSYNVVTPDYFRVAGIAVLEGRALEERDGQEAVVVNRITAERTWPGQSAIGQRIRFRDDSPWSTVVGVVAAVPSAAGEAAVAGVYVPIAFEQLATMTLIVRHDGDPGLAITAVRNVIAGLDSEVPITRIVSLRDTIAETLARPRYTAAIVALFGAAALLLACTGVYGVLAYAVAQRSKEMGIRMAIGAAPADLGGLVLREGASLVVLGVSIGLAGAIATARLITGLLYGVSPADPILLSAVGAAIISAGLAACLGPAVRAARTDAQRSIGAD
jgi:predicted permease